MNSKIVLLLLVIIGLFVRIFQINSLPPSLNWDEVSIGYNSYSIAQKGIDEWGEKFPLIFRAYGDYKLPTYLYLSVPIIKTFGLTELSTKLVSIIAGVLLIPVVYLLLKHLTHDSHISLLGSLLLALAPWHIFTSRIALESNLMLTIFALGIYLLLKKKWNISLLLFCLCIFTYNSARVLFPFWLLLYIYNIYKHKVNFIHILPGFIILLLTLLLVFKQTFIDDTGQARYRWVSLLDSGAINYINEKRGQTGNTIFSKVVYNRPAYFLTESAKNYFNHFDPRFIFISGSSNFQFNIPNFPLLAPPLFIFLLLGIFISLKKYKQLVFLWLISPIPSSITRDAPHTLRSLIFIFITTILVVLGVLVFKQKYKNILIYCVAIISCIFCIVYFKSYSTYAINYASSWQYGYKQAINYILINQQKYTNIYFTKKYGEPHEYLAYYSKFDPSEYSKYKNWDYHADWYWINSYKNIKFVNDWEINKLNLPNNTLLITSPNNYPQKGKILETITYPNGDPVFQILQYEN